MSKHTGWLCLEQGIDAFLFAHYPEDVTGTELAGGLNGGEVLLALLDAYHHAAVNGTDAAVDYGLADEGAVRTEHQLVELHFALLEVRVNAKHLLLNRIAKGGQLRVGANGLYFVTRENEVVAIGDVQAVVGTQNAADVDTILSAPLQLAQGVAHPAGVHGDVEISHVDIAV